MKISDLFSIDDIIYGTNRIFDFLKEKEDLQEFINNGNVEHLNSDYYLNHSNDKFISPFVEKLFNNGNSIIDITSLVADIVYSRFSTKWIRIYDALMEQYKPLENYSMEETRTPNLTINETTNEDTDINVNRKTNATNSYKGFNADEPVTINQTDGEEDVTTTGAKADNELTKETKHTGTETLVRSGNIGVTSSQQMLEQELKVRQYDFYNMIYNDIDSILCLSIY